MPRKSKTIFTCGLHYRNRYANIPTCSRHSCTQRSGEPGALFVFYQIQLPAVNDVTDRPSYQATGAASANIDAENRVPVE